MRGWSRLRNNVKFMSGLALVVAGLTLIGGWYFRAPTREIGREELVRLLESGGLREARVTPTPYAGFFQVEGRLAGREKVYASARLSEAQQELLLGLAGVKVELAGQGLRGQGISVISTLLIAALVIGVAARQARVGQSRAARVRRRPAVTFQDVAGIEEAKGEVREIVDFLRDPQKYRRLGGSLPKGVLLVGPPGTGKTMLAKAIAGEANAGFFSAHGSDFTEVFVGVGARRVRHLFRQAAQHQPAIIFIDEIDCVGKNRKLDSHSEHQQTINALLAAMDGFEGSEGIIVVAATNRPEDLDEALLRPGRFDRKVHVPYPDRRGRRAILRTHAAGKPIADEERALEAIAQTTPGMSGADLANLMNEAAILCARKNADAIRLPDLEAARDKVRYGQERKSLVLRPRERELVAYHEAGHTIAHLRTTTLPPLYKVSIVPRGQALGVTTLLPEEDQNLHSKQFLLEQLLVLMGGRAAETTFFQATTNGAAGDLQSARNIARKMVHEWGMGEKLYYEVEQRAAEAEINRLLENADRAAHRLIEERKDATHQLAQALLEKETLTRQEILDLLHPAPVQA